MKNPEEIIHECAWCEKEIPDDTPVYGLGIKALPDFDLSKYEGEAIEFVLVNVDKTINALVPPKGSAAKEDGNDLMVMTCSSSCGNALKKALQEDIDLRAKLEKINLL